MPSIASMPSAAVHAMEQMQSHCAVDVKGGAHHSDPELNMVHAELARYRKKVNELQHEVDEASSWASDLQDIWAKTEHHWLEKMRQLRQRASSVAEQDTEEETQEETQEPPHDASEPVEAERLLELESLLQAAERRAELAEKATFQAAQGAPCILELEARIVEDGRQGALAEASALAGEAGLVEITAACQQSEQSMVSWQGEVQLATTWAEETMAKCEAEIEEKNKELTQIKRDLEAAQKRLQMRQPESVPSGSEQDAPNLRVLGQELQTQLISMEAQLRSERNLCDEVANREKSTKQASQVILAKQAEAARHESERCADLQKELNCVNQEIKSSKGNSKAQRVQPAVRKLIDEFRHEEKVARKECARSDEALEIALSFIDLNKERHASRCERTHDKQSGKMFVDEVALTLEPEDSISSGKAVGKVTVAKLGAQAHLSGPRTKSNKAAARAASTKMPVAPCNSGASKARMALCLSQ